MGDPEKSKLLKIAKSRQMDGVPRTELSIETDIDPTPKVKDLSAILLIT
jgi:hypothetical protein